jgi:hypothetical protein
MAAAACRVQGLSRHQVAFGGWWVLGAYFGCLDRIAASCSPAAKETQAQAAAAPIS